MKKNDFAKLIDLFGMPLLMIVAGLILILNPDSASALLTRILGWGLLAWAAVTAVLGVTSPVRPQTGRFLLAGALALAGIFLLANPMSLAVGLGWGAGIVLLLRFLPQCVSARREGLPLPVLPVILSVLGGVLIVLPLMASRLIFGVGGVLLLCAGAALLADALRGRKRLEAPDDSNIIDAAE